MAHSEMDIKIGCTGEENEENYKSFSLSLSLQEAKINQYNKYIQKALNIKKTPILTVELDSEHAEANNIQLFGNQFEITKKTVQKKTIFYGDIKNNDKMLFIRKIQRAFHLMTQLKVQFNGKLYFYDIEKKLQHLHPSLTELLNGFKLKGNIKMDEKTPEVFKKCLVKVSPKFIQSPIFLFIEMFVELDFKLDLQSLDFLEKESQNMILQKLFNLKEQNQNLVKNLKSLKNSHTKMVICLQKLALIEIEGPAELISLIYAFL